MMSLTTTSLAHNVKQLYRYKLHAYFTVFGSLIAVQLLGLLLSLNGVGQFATYFDHIYIHVNHFSANFIIIFSLMWVFIIAVTVTTQPYRDADFVFVANRMSSHLSNILFLLTASVIGGVTAMLCGFVLKLVAGYILYQDLVFQQTLSLPELLLGLAAASLYMILLSSAGFLAGMLSQLHKAVKFVLPALVLAMLIMETGSPRLPIMIMLAQFFTNEDSFVIFVIKVAASSSLLFGTALLISNRLEVRQ